MQWLWCDVDCKDDDGVVKSIPRNCGVESLDSIFCASVTSIFRINKIKSVSIYIYRREQKKE